MNYKVFVIKEANCLTGRLLFSQENDRFYFYTHKSENYKLKGTYTVTDNIYSFKVNSDIYGSFDIDGTNYKLSICHNGSDYSRQGGYEYKLETLDIISTEGPDIDNLDSTYIKNITPDKLLTNTSFCMAPWVHLYMQSSGIVFPCCKAKKAILGNLNKTSYKELWNSEKLKKIRLNMLAGNKIPACESCNLNQSRWGNSYRNYFNNNYLHLYNRVKNTNADGSLDKMELKYADFRISNLCNFKCRTCSSHSSSSWYEDEKKLGWNSSPVKIFNVWQNLKEQVPEIIDTVEKINFAGGEPLLIKENYEILDSLIEKKRFDVELTYNTNLSILNYNNMNICDKWKLFDSIIIKASLDGIKERGEYIRKGLVWQDFFKNRYQLSKQVPRAKIKIFVTVQLFNVLHLPEMYEFLVKYKFVDSSNLSTFHLSFLEEPKIYDIRSLSPAVKEEVRAVYHKFFDKHSNNEKLINHFKSVLTVMDEDTYDMKQAFKETTMQLDVLRKESAVATFPELKTYFKECGFNIN